jgi:NADPH:quinone reductase-like Zn-dependent oxidoreductase
MRQAEIRAFGGPEVVKVAEAPRPKADKGQVLIRVHAAGVNSGDARIRAKNVPRGFGPFMDLVFGFEKPRKPVLGTELAGEVVEVGKGASRFAVGDRVFADTGFAMGAHAEFVALSEKGAIAPIPDGMSYEDAAAISFGGTVAILFFKRGARVKAGETVLINGASGSVGLAMVQYAKVLGARVTGVSSAANHDLLRLVGADAVVDYHSQDVAGYPETFDVVADCIGNLPYRRARGLLARGGRFAQVVGTLAETILAPFQSLVGPHRIIGGTAAGTASDLGELAGLAQSGKVRPVVDKVFAFEDIAKAHAYVDTGHKCGHVVVRM